MSESKETMVWDGETSGVINAYRSVIQADRELLAQIQKTLATSERGSKEWQQAKLKESQILRQIANDTNKVENAQESARKKIEQVGTTGKAAGDAMSKAFGAAQSVIGAIGLNQLLQELIAYKKELASIESAHKKAFAPVDLAANLRSPAIRRDVGKEAVRAGVSVEQAASTAAGLMREGVSRQDATGATLRESLTAQQVLGREAGEQITGLLDSQKIDITAANIRGVAEALEALRVAHVLSDKDLGQFVSQVSSAGHVFRRAQLDIKEQFAVSAALKDRGVEGGAGALETVVTKLSKLAGDKGAQEALGNLGLTERDVSLRPARGEDPGQDLLQVIEKLDRALSSRVPPEERGAVLAEIVGKQTGVVETLMEEMREGKVQSLLAAQQTGAAYNASQQMALSSEGAVLQRLKTGTEIRKGSRAGQDAEIMRGALEATLTERGVNPLMMKQAMEKYDTGLITGSPAAALENVQAMFPKKRALDSSGTKFDPASDPRSIREEVIDRARQAKRPEPLGDVGADDLAPTMADRIPDYAGPSLSERKAKASEKLGDDPILKNLRLELDGLRLEEDRFKSVVSRAAAAGQPKSKLETDDQLRKMKAAIDAKELEVKEREYFLKAAQPRAGGGPVSAGKPYMVGEAGKELFVPGESGQVVPNSSLADFRDRFADFQIRRALTGIDRDASAKRTFLNLNTGRSRGSRRARGKSQGDFGEPSGGGTSGELEQPFLKVEPDQGFTPPKSFLTGGGPPPPGSPAAAAAAKAEGASLGPKLDAILTAIQQTNGFLSALQERSVLRNAMLT